jgi:hypothetical protein
MLSDSAIALMRDVLGNDHLFGTSRRVTRRVVAWGPHAEPVTLDHGAVAVSEQELLDELGREGFADESASQPDGTPDGTPDWTIAASAPLPGDTVENRFGARTATATPVELRADSESNCCWMESLEDGWLFLIGNAPGAGWLLAVGAPTGELIDKSRLISKQIASLGPEQGRFSSAPRIVAPLCGDTSSRKSWLACGSAAMTFDPICGDGTAHAVREAILAAAVIRAIENGGDEASLKTHYEARLTAGFRRHLELCLAFYRSGGSGEWWQREALGLRNGIDWSQHKLGVAPAFDYRLNGFDLQRISSAIPDL